MAEFQVVFDSAVARGIYDGVFVDFCRAVAERDAVGPRRQAHGVALRRGLDGDRRDNHRTDRAECDASVLAVSWLTCLPISVPVEAW